MEVSATNTAIQDGRLQKTINSIMELIKPEASYFTTVNGKRTAYLFFELKDSSMILQIAEPIFQTLGAEVDFYPVMNREDLNKGLHSYFESQKAA
jgi:hypothetical protein